MTPVDTGGTVGRVGMATARARCGWGRTFGLPFALVCVVLAIYLANGRFNESTDTFGNELLPISILQHGTLSFDQYYAGPGPDGAYPTGHSALVGSSFPVAFDYRLAPEIPSKSIPWWFVRTGGRVISLYPIAPGLLNTPVFLAAKVLGVSGADNVVPLTHVTTSLIAAVSVACMYLCLIQVCNRQRAALFFALNFAFATAVWSANSRSLFQHGAAVLFLTAALAAVVSQRIRLVRVAGLLLGLMVVTRPTTVLIAAALALFVYRHERSAFPGFAALAAIPAVLIGWYSWAYWGTPLALGQGHVLSTFSAPEPAAAVVGLLVSPNRGLLVFSPIFMFSVGYAVYVLRRKTDIPLLPYLIWSSVAVFALYSCWSDWAGGHTYGYRFLIELVPTLTLLLALCWERFLFSRPYLRTLFLMAMVASVYVHGLGAVASPCGFDDEPDNLDIHHERLWDIANGEIVRCTVKEATAWEPALGVHEHGTN